MQEYQFTGIDGNMHTILGCGIKDLVELKKCFALLQKILSKEKKRHWSFTDFYLNNYECQLIVDRILRLNSIDSNWISIDMALALVHHTETEHGIDKSILEEINNL